MDGILSIIQQQLSLRLSFTDNILLTTLTQGTTTFLIILASLVDRGMIKFELSSEFSYWQQMIPILSVNYLRYFHVWFFSIARGATTFRNIGFPYCSINDRLQVFFNTLWLTISQIISNNLGELSSIFLVEQLYVQHFTNWHMTIMIKHLSLLFYISHVAIIFKLRILLLLHLFDHYFFELENRGQMMANEGINSAIRG